MSTPLTQLFQAAFGDSVPPPPKVVGRRRKKLWELSHRAHCPLVAFRSVGSTAAAPRALADACCQGRAAEGEFDAQPDPAGM